MRKFIFLFFLITGFTVLPSIAQTGAVTGYCTSGAQKALVSGLSSTNTLQGIVPSCTVTVYLTGTTTLANPIYSNAAGTPLGNPFTAATSGQWLFFAGLTQLYDVVLSGGSAPNAYSLPMVITGVQASATGTIFCLISGCTMSGDITAPNLVPVGPGSYTLYVNSGTVYARNNNTMLIAYSGTDAAVVINQVLNSLVSVGGRIYFQNGTYPLNSCTAETVSPYSSIHYAVGIPSTNAVNYPSFEFEGETAGIGSQVHPATRGVVFNVTSAAVSCAGGGTIAGFWMRPNTAYDTEYPVGSLYWNDHILFKDIAVNFPDNTVANEVGIDALEASFLGVDHVQIGFNTFSTALGATGDVAFISPATPSDGALIQETQVDPGFWQAYQINTEHNVLINTENWRATTGYTYGWQMNRNNSPIYHSGQWIHPQCYDDVNCIAAGTNLASSVQLDILGLDLEYTTTGPWAYSSPITTLGPLQPWGLLTWDQIQTNVGPGSLPSPFATGSGYGYIPMNNGAVIVGNELTVANQNTTTLPSVSIGNFTMPSLAAGNVVATFLGVSNTSLDNGIYSGFHYTGFNSASNWATFSFPFSTNNNISMMANGNNCVNHTTNDCTAAWDINGTFKLGSGGTVSKMWQWVSQTTNLCTATANSSCTFTVTFPDAFFDTSWHIICTPESATSAVGIITGGWPITNTTSTGMNFRDLSGSSNTLMRATCQAWE